ncbi:MAG: radical SAM protein [Planctomycetota bacterium]|jgi:ABC-2 type transport system ATP-binding protein|nr:radical SAM protein [Planctomycetota bacterium]
MNPVIRLFETHLVDHCNLPCAGCSHFSPIAPEHYADPDLFARVMLELARKVELKRVRLLGGEPLLHPEVNKFMIAARRAYPEARIGIVTNGLLLKAMKDDFWETAAAHDIVFDISRYPVNADKLDAYVRLVEEKGCRKGNIAQRSDMGYILNSRGDSDPAVAYKRCRELYKSHVNMRGRRLYLCGRCYLDYFNDFFGQNYPLDRGIDIFEASGDELFRYVTTPIELCKYCLETRPFVNWSRSRGKLREWDCFAAE